MFDESAIDNLCTIKVFGVGGGGNNAINRMVESNIEGVDFVALNTDAQVLNSNKAGVKIVLGLDSNRGLGAGGNPEIGRNCTEESEEEIKRQLKGADMVFIAAGMGGGTGTGAAPLIAQYCKEMGILTIGIVTRPFTFEGKQRNANAVEGLQKLRPFCDSLIVINNDQLLQVMGQQDFRTAFKACDDILCHSVKILTELIVKPALINLDFNDVKTVMQDKGTALIGMGRGRGENRARDAAVAAVTSPLLDLSIKGAKNAIVFINGGRKMTPLDFHEAVEIIRSNAENPDINLIFGVNEDLDMNEDEMELTVIATEFDDGDFHFVDKPIEEKVDINEIDILETFDEPIQEPINVEENLEDFNEDEIFEDKKKKGFLPNFLTKLKRR